MKAKMLLAKATKKASIVAGMTGLKLQKKSPEIFLALGIVGMGVSLVWACKQTMKVEKIKAIHEEEMNAILEVEELRDKGELSGEDSYTTEDAARDKLISKLRLAGGYIRLFWGPFSVFALSTASILVAYRIINRRYLGAVAAFNTVSGAFRDYRKRVIEDGGRELDRKYMYGAETETVTKTITDENGKKKKVKEEVERIEIDGVEGPNYSVVFDSRNPNWDENIDFVMLFLRGQEAIHTEILQSRGYVFLNEVRDALGLPAIPNGQKIGWLKDDPMCDGCIDFGLDDMSREDRIRFINGDRDSLLLEFNHCGIIWDKI